MVNPFRLLDRKEKVSATDSSREHLTRDEINRIIDTPCRREDIKRAFLFSCFCGLRMGDIKNLRWGDIKEDNGQFSLSIKMKKTGHALSLPLNDAAVALMGERSENMEERVFPKFAVSTGPTIEYNLGLLMDAAGIKKHITFHCGRHSFACLSLDLGVDLYVVSKLLGHRSIAVTQIYGKISDAEKTNAVNQFNGVFHVTNMEGIK